MRSRKQAAAVEKMKAAGKVKIKFKKIEDRALLVDADIVAYQAVTECLVETRNSDDEWTYVCDMKRATEMVELRLQDHLTALNADKIVLAFGSANNWRKRVMAEYKANRKDRRKPLGYKALVEWMSGQWPTKTAPDLEADDLIGIMATDAAFMPGTDKVIVSEDKDFNGVPGKLFNPRKPEDGTVFVNAGMADKFHMLQTLTGDPSDGYKGCPGCGPVKAAEVLEGAKDAADAWNRVVAAYVAKGLTEVEALQNARVARILRRTDVDSRGNVILWTPPSKASKKGKS